MSLINLKTDAKVISPENGQYFFGYYDLKAYDKTDSIHLCNRPQFIDRLPTENDVLDLGYINLKSGEFTKFADTTLWNFQQGCLLQWYADTADEVCYNVKTKNGESTCIHNLKTGEKRYTERACACISPDGRYGLSVNFQRIYDFRPGYGYCGKDPFADEKRPENDGIYLVDMKTGKSKLIIRYADCWKQFPLKGMENSKFLVNHITFNTASNRFLFLLRNFADSEIDGMWLTSLITSDLEGNMYPVLKNTYVSHYYWKNDRQILAHCTPKDKKGLFLLDDMSKDYTQMKSPFFEDDLHCIYSPDQKYIIGDGYPFRDGYRTLWAYNPETEKTECLLKAETITPDIVDIRCDLHARWNRKGDKISFDTTDRGKREIVELDVSGLNI